MASSFPIPAIDTDSRLPTDEEYDFSGVTQYLFNRAYSFSIGTPGQNGKAYSRLRIVFDIVKTSSFSSNKAKIQVYNLNDESRKTYVKGLQIAFKAGYDGLLETVFQGGTEGTNSRVTNERKGPDVITTFECGDGEGAIVNTVFDRSYPPGTPYVLVVKDLVKVLNGAGISNGSFIGLTSGKVFNNGAAISGPVSRNLDKILSSLNLSWSVQNGEIQILPVGGNKNDRAIVISQTTGLIGTPTMGIGGDNVVTFTSLLNPKLNPGARVSISSNLFSGIFTVRNTKFEGDTHGSKWQVTCECVPLNANLANISQSISDLGGGLGSIGSTA